MTEYHSASILSKMQKALPKEALMIIRRLAALADRRGLNAYIVGGFVRDLLLGKKNLDVDLVVEGDAIKFAAAAADKLDAALVIHKRFGTAALIMRKEMKRLKLKIDIATARTEAYRYPAALPSVTIGSIRNDLYRRDFTINAMAAVIGKKDFGRLIDFFGGRKDLNKGVIRVLHDRSFIDDPTRIFRAVRFAQRYNFKIEKHTVSLIRNAVEQEIFDKVSGERLRKELRLLLMEKEPLKAIRRMRSLHELKFINPGIKFDIDSEEICKNIKKLSRQFKKYFLKKRNLDMWLIYFMMLLDKLSLMESLKVCGRFAMRRSDRLRIVSCKKSGKKIINILSDKKAVTPSRIYKLLEPISYEGIMFLTAKCASRLMTARVKDFLRRYHGARLRINGSDLKRLGIRPGPDFSRILTKALYAKLDGILRTKKDEILFAKQFAKKGGK